MDSVTSRIAVARARNSMRPILASILVALACSRGADANANPGSMPQHRALAGSLMAADRAFAADSRARGAAAWAAAWAQRGRKDAANGQAVGPGAAAASIAPTLERYGSRFRWEPDTATMLWPDTLGYTVGHWWIDPDTGSAPLAEGRYLTAWIREDNAWRVALDLSLATGAVCADSASGQFDFWTGEWGISQRILGDSGGFREFAARNAVARVSPCALIENWRGTVQFPWAGMASPREIRGASVRVYDPDAKEWQIYWIDTTDPAFGAPFHGGFESDVGAFVAEPLQTGGAERRIRFTRAGSAVDWELSVHQPSGEWSPLWMMHFERR
jgi:hypothetical protein